MKVYYLTLKLIFLSHTYLLSQNFTTDKVVKTDLKWKTQLTNIEYNVLRLSDTEKAFSGKYNKFYKEGIYLCKGCDTPLFRSEHKYDSGSGWPSFDRGIKGHIGYTTDKELGYTRTEIHCYVCNGHLGHVFNDGPKKTTGQRYCVNSVALKFKPLK
ncbi:MAG: peptide-methionine (R)-S-oxide reductase MsrB [Flavobacteriaceae bacterium]